MSIDKFPPKVKPVERIPAYWKELKGTDVPIKVLVWLRIRAFGRTGCHLTAACIAQDLGLDYRCVWRAISAAVKDGFLLREEVTEGGITVSKLYAPQAMQDKQPAETIEEQPEILSIIKPASSLEILREILSCAEVLAPPPRSVIGKIGVPTAVDVIMRTLPKSVAFMRVLDTAVAAGDPIPCVQAAWEALVQVTYGAGKEDQDVSSFLGIAAKNYTPEATNG